MTTNLTLNYAFEIPYIPRPRGQVRVQKNNYGYGAGHDNWEPWRGGCGTGALTGLMRKRG